MIELTNLYSELGGSCRANSIEDARVVKINDLRMRCSSEIERVYPKHDQVNAALGVSGAPALNDIKTKIEACRSTYQSLKSSVIAATNEAEINAIVWPEAPDA